MKHKKNGSTHTKKQQKKTQNHNKTKNQTSPPTKTHKNSKDTKIN